MTGRSGGQQKTLRSQDWFDNADEPGLSVLYLERFMNYGLSREELQSGRPIIGISQTGSDLAPCNRHHLQLADRLRAGIRDAGGIPMEFGVHPIQETCRRPTAALDRNLSYLSQVEVLHGYPLDGVVFTTGCDKTTPAALMAAATTDLPAIVFSGGPMLNGWLDGERVGSGTILFKAREKFARGEIDEEGYWRIVSSGAPSAGHCNTMGTASTMNCLAEALGMSLPDCASIPGPHQARAEMAYETGRAAVVAVLEDRRPSTIMTRAAFENAIRVCSAIGGSTNAIVHLNAIASLMGIELSMRDWQQIGHDIPLLVNMQPAGEYLGEEFWRAGGVRAVLAELANAGLLHTSAPTISGEGIGKGVKPSRDREVIRSFDNPLLTSAGFRVLSGNIFNSAIMKSSGISAEFRSRYLEDPKDPDAFTGSAVVFEGPEDYASHIDDVDLEIDENSILVMRGVGPIGHPGSAEVVNMQPPKHLLKQGFSSLPCIGDGRQSGTSGSPSILHASPEAAAGGNLALLQTGDRIRVDLAKGTVNVDLDPAELQERRARLEAAGGYAVPPSQTPWQQLHRDHVNQLDVGMAFDLASDYQQVCALTSLPRFNH
ncbi:IlvD/Edd family dehydratase [Demetria terragena]|uniref:IlvD/Edd family dehydratase n=1 Tax=Demetria terragena TaxID=63959 RepID=UPI0003674B01|nr:IlvD/Edd family dehydratase [Demetria terragena]